MTVIVPVKCACGETHRLYLSRVLAAGFRKPPARTTDCRQPNRRPDQKPPDPACTQLHDQPLRDELALAFC